MAPQSRNRRSAFKPSAGERSARGGVSSVPPAYRADIVAKPNADLRVLLPNVAFKKHTFKLGYAVLSPAEEFDAIVKAEHAKWGRIVIESGMRTDE